jgi:hypothetical protein
MRFSTAASGTSFTRTQIFTEASSPSCDPGRTAALPAWRRAVVARCGPQYYPTD